MAGRAEPNASRRHPEFRAVSWHRSYMQCPAQMVGPRSHLYSLPAGKTKSYAGDAADGKTRGQAGVRVAGARVWVAGAKDKHHCKVPVLTAGCQALLVREKGPWKAGTEGMAGPRQAGPTSVWEAKIMFSQGILPKSQQKCYQCSGPGCLMGNAPVGAFDS